MHPWGQLAAAKLLYNLRPEFRLVQPMKQFLKNVAFAAVISISLTSLIVAPIYWLWYDNYLAGLAGYEARVQIHYEEPVFPMLTVRHSLEIGWAHVGMPSKETLLRLIWSFQPQKGTESRGSLSFRLSVR
jgi:hypothetical protein